MKQRIADIVMAELGKLGLTHVFMLSGGGIMYLVDALGSSPLEHVCCHHEQAASIAAQAYAMQRKDLGCCLITTGPGGTNALTGCAAAYVDSTPVLFLSGQVKTADFASLRHVRQFGAQENDIISMARPVTKYAVLADNPNTVLLELQKALYIATHGRKGPVWLDIPLDVQCAEVDAATLPQFSPDQLQESMPDVTIQQSKAKIALNKSITDAQRLLATAKRPLLLAGHGITAAGAESLFRQLAQQWGIPVVSTWRGLGLLDGQSPLFFGSPGLQAPRYSNIITQAADVILVLGSRLDNMITAFSESNFGKRAQKIIVDIDAPEMEKLDMAKALRIHCDVKNFLEALLEAQPVIPVDSAPWLDFCHAMRQRFPLLEEKQDKTLQGAYLYQVAASMGEESSAQDAVVISSTSRCNTAGHIAFSYKEGQHPISSMGMGSMGFALPSVIGAWFASPQHSVLMLEGDGSLQLNIQELQTIKHHNINAKLFIYSNHGYAAIATMQDRNFEGRRVGSDAQSGVTMPPLKSIAAAYGIPYSCIDDNASIQSGIQAALRHQGPVICEVMGDINFDEIPKCISHVDATGKRVSAALENPYPFLAETEIQKIFSVF